MTGKPSVPIAIEVYWPTAFAGSSTVVITGEDVERLAQHGRRPS